MVMLTRFLLLASALSGVFPMSAQGQANLAVQALSLQSQQCWTSGSGVTYLKVCISKHGNVIQLVAPAGIENIARGEIGEGYAACAATSAASAPVVYYDAAAVETGWAEPYKVTTSPPKIHRKTKDGRLELVQTFSRDSAELDFTITMTLYNRSGKTLYNVRLDRYADLDVHDGGPGDSFLRTPRSVVVADSDSVVTMSDLGTGTPATAVHAWGEWRRDACNQASAYSPTARADWVGRISYNFGTLANGASKTVSLVYSAN
jgi:hypothetical protein